MPAQCPSAKALLRPAEALRARRLPPPRLKRLLLPKAAVPLRPALKEAELLLTLPEMTAEQPLKPRRSLPGKECSCLLMVVGCPVGLRAGREAGEGAEGAGPSVLAHPLNSMGLLDGVSLICRSETSFRPLGAS